MSSVCRVATGFRALGCHGKHGVLCWFQSRAVHGLCIRLCHMRYVGLVARASWRCWQQHRCAYDVTMSSVILWAGADLVFKSMRVAMDYCMCPGLCMASAFGSVT
jgi:hypothetical protein